MTPKERKTVTPTALRAYIELMNIWQVPVQQRWQLLGGTPPFNLLYFDKDQAQKIWPLTEDQLGRITLLLQIAKILRSYFQKTRANQWVTRINTHPLFQGKTVVIYMIENGRDSMVRVRNYLASKVYGGFW